jgi:phosphoribosyl-AMP cyclohydrolase/phosphoribosyl-ATP pyrophosphohydrolase/phosphoribosyl-AMP cyclohydrolase
MTWMPDAPAVTPVPLRDEDLARVRYNDDGLVAAIVQDVETRAVLMMAWMNAETLRMSLEQGRTVFWSRSRQEVWRKGDTSGDRQFIRSAHVDCDGDTLLFLVEQEGAGACHTGSYTCFFRAFGSDTETTDRPGPA